MNYWVTTHWPHLVSDPINKPHEGIWVQDQKWDAIKRIAPGDLAFIYESRTGRNVVGHSATGQQITIPRRIGREGVIALVEISGPPNQPDHTQREEYTNGSSAWWRFHAPTRSLNSGGFVPRADLAALL